MPRSSPLAAAGALVLLIFQLLLAGRGTACTAPGADARVPAAATAAMPAGMAMPSDTPSDAPRLADTRHPTSPPCETPAGSTAPCQPMAPCAPGFMGVRAIALGVAVRAVPVAVATAVRVPPSPVTAPDLPPPRAAV